jgi:hypothetical protein
MRRSPSPHNHGRPVLQRVRTPFRRRLGPHAPPISDKKEPRGWGEAGFEVMAEIAGRHDVMPRVGITIRLAQAGL